MNDPAGDGSSPMSFPVAGSIASVRSVATVVAGGNRKQ